MSRLAAIREGVGQFERRFQGEGVVPGEYFLVSTTRHILLSKGANCTVLRAVVLTQYRRVADGQTDGIAVASTALAKLCAVIKLLSTHFICRSIAELVQVSCKITSPPFSLCQPVQGN